MRKNKALEYVYKGKSKKMKVVITTYTQNNRLCIELNHRGDYYMTLTSNLPSQKCCENQAYISGDAITLGFLEFVEKHQLGKPTGEYGYSGLGRYPLFEFNMDRLKELDPDGYAAYERTIRNR